MLLTVSDSYYLHLAARYAVLLQRMAPACMALMHDNVCYTDMQRPDDRLPHAASLAVIVL
jgi:hypothetical protein